MMCNQLPNMPRTKPKTSWSKPGLMDPLQYVFTSGTTGMPKAATIRHSRYFLMGWALYGMCAIRTATDILYTMLPMYHSSASGLITGACMVGGVTVVTRKKFSASNYWKDCIKHNVTVAQYIGEVARYLVQTPPTDLEKQHKVRMMCGNGLRPQIWEEVRSRFNVDICEFYGATEGNCSMINFSNRTGAIGFSSRILPFLVPLSLAKVDPATGEILRDPDTGLVQICKIGEQGELIAPIHKGNPIRDYDGYVAKSDSVKKMLHDVYKKGDVFFKSGDMLVQDDLGFFYFLDRCGDTFRWKGENVSTTEVEGLLQKVIGADKDVAVYGVTVPGCEGRAGMAAVAMPQGRKFDLRDLYEKVEKTIPFYARPVFIRLTGELEITGTHKIKKTSLQKAAFDPRGTTDSVLAMDKAKKTYVPLTEELYSDIMEGRVQY